MQWGFLFQAYRVSKKLLRAWQERRDGAGTWVRQGACWGLSPVTLGHRGVARAGVGVSSRGAWGGGACVAGHFEVPVCWVGRGMERGERAVQPCSFPGAQPLPCQVSERT